MPQNKLQRTLFAFLTVVITVHAYVFYSLYVVNGTLLMELNGTVTVLDAIRAQGGVYMFGTMLPIWAVVLVEFVCAFSLDILLGQPFSFRIASRLMDPQTTHPFVFETLIISATVWIMCPTMSLIAAFLYYPYYAGFRIVTLLANWFKLVCCNFPFAWFSQIFFIQPLVRKIFGLLYAGKQKA